MSTAKSCLYGVHETTSCPFFFRADTTSSIPRIMGGCGRTYLAVRNIIRALVTCFFFFFFFSGYLTFPSHLKNPTVRPPECSLDLIASSSSDLHGSGTTFESNFHGCWSKTDVRRSLRSGHRFSSDIYIVGGALDYTRSGMPNRTNGTMDSLLPFHRIGHVTIWHAAMTRLNTVEKVERGRYTNRPA